MLSLKSTALLLAFSLSGAAAFAECEIITTRVACPGEEEAAMKPYGGKNPTTDKKPAAKTAEACEAIRKKDETIKRKGTLSKKDSVAMFDGKEVGKGSDSKPCK